jgi:hypothetical protein
MPLLGRQVHTDWEALLIMQQYGFPTRLLDWSRALAVAAYFAVRDLNVQKDGAVWIMAPRHLMEVRGISGSWRTIIDNECLNSLCPRVNTVGLEEFCAQTPVALSPDQLVSRMIAQRGIYTLHSFERFALERLAVADRIKHENGCFLHKVIVPEAAKPGFRADIRILAGVSEESLFPDLDGLARDIVADHRERALQREGRPTRR